MAAAITIPVAVVMERREVAQGRWRVPAWAAVSTLSAEHLAGGVEHGTLMRDGESAQQYLWSGLRLDLFRDSAESYWYNLTGENASLYVICHESPDGDLEPALVTADHDEAVAGLEGDDKVFATPIPPDIYQAIERFVVENYKPEAPRKRKRKSWNDRKA